MVETIKGTSEHPFFVEGRGFVPLSDLGVGTTIVPRAGPSLVVKSLTRESHPEGIFVYNFEVEDYHTYFVGKAGAGIWVHNNDCIPSRMHTINLSNPAWRRTKFGWKDKGLVYLLKDAKTGEILKVGETSGRSVIGRFNTYVSAGKRNNRNLSLDVFETPYPMRWKIEIEIRENLGKEAGSLIWDNTGRRLGRSGPGIP